MDMLLFQPHEEKDSPLTLGKLYIILDFNPFHLTVSSSLSHCADYNNLKSMTGSVNFPNLLFFSKWF